MKNGAIYDLIELQGTSAEEPSLKNTVNGEIPMANTLNGTQATKRIPSIDRFRGTVIFCMIVFQFIAGFPNLGAISHISSHAPKETAIYILPNLAIADVVAPMFILAIGLTYIPSFRRRAERSGTKVAVLHFLGRYLSLIGIGMCMNGINNILNGDSKPLNYVIIALTIAVLVSGLITLILKVCKAKKAGKVCGKIVQYLVILLGVLGICITTVNFIMLCLGKTDHSFGYWLVLHHIGFAGLVALPFANLKGKKGSIIRLVAGIIIVALFALFHEGNLPHDAFDSNRELIDVVADGGLSGGFAYGGMLLIYTFFADMYYEGKKNYFISLGIFAVPVAALIAAVFATLPEGTTAWAGALSSFLPINKGSVSPSYVIITAFISLVAFAVYDAFNFYKSRFDPLAWYGKNPILLYIIEFAVIGGINAALGDFFKTASVLVSAIIVIVTVALLTLFAYVLNKKNVVLKL